MFAFSCFRFKLRIVPLATRSVIPREKVVIVHHISNLKFPLDSVPVVDPDVPSTVQPATMDDADSDSAIAQQKMRAIQYWNESKLNHSEPLKNQVHDNVMQHLQQGEVLPILHTLCRPPNERLFSPDARVSVEDPNSDRIQLSVLPVTMGECEPKTEAAGQVSMCDEKSYISDFFRNDGLAKFCVSDSDSSFQWKYSKNFTEIVTGLVNEPSKMIGEDVEVTKLIETVAVDYSSGHNLITRRLSRGVVADCFAKSNAGSTYAIVGNCGIGKSWTLLYALQQSLLYENVCVLLCMQKYGKAIVCQRRTNKIFVWMSYDDHWEQGCYSRLFYNSNVLVLLDPRDAEGGGACFTQGKRMLIMAASNNANHFGGISKVTPCFARYLSLYTDEELKVAVPFMVKNDAPPISMDDVLERANFVGNLPCYIMSDVRFEYRQRLIYKSIKKLGQKERKEFLSIDGLNRTHGLAHESIVAVNVKTCSRKSDSDASSDAEQYGECYTGNCKESLRVGYDGQDVFDYGEVAFNVISKMVLNEIVKISRQDILSFWGITSSDCMSKMVGIVETLFWEDLKNSCPMRIIPMKINYADISGKGTILDVGKCEHIEEITLNELREKVFDERSSVVARMKDKEALFDFAGPGRRVYHVAVRHDDTPRSILLNGVSVPKETNISSPY